MLEPARLRSLLTVRNAWLVLVCALWGVLRFAHAEINDDAMITFVYARNLVAGEGLVFNPGEAIYGTTVPLFAIFVAIGMKLGFEPWTWVLGWDVVWGALMFWRMRQILDVMVADFAGSREETLPGLTLGMRNSFWIASVLLLLTAPKLLPVAGMETGLVVALMLSALTHLARGDVSWRPVAWATGLALLRPDGVILLGVVGGYVAWNALRTREWKPGLRAMAPVLALGVYALFLLAVFGTIVPQSVRAKAVTGALAAPEALFLHGWWGDIALFYVVPWYIGSFAVIGMFVSLSIRSVRAPVILYVLYAAFFILGNSPDFLWYRTPLLVLQMMFAAIALCVIGFAIGSLILRCFKSIRSPIVIRVVTSVWSLLILEAMLLEARDVIVILHDRGFRDYGVNLDQVAYRRAALWIAERDPAPRLAAHEIGHLGYHANGHVHDLEGLVTPAAVDARRQSRDPLEDADVRWWVHPISIFAPPHWRTEMFDRAARYGFVPVHRLGWDHGSTFVFERLERPAPPDPPVGLDGVAAQSADRNPITPEMPPDPDGD